MEFVMIETGWMSVIPPVLAITLALITKEVYSSLFIGRFRLRGPLLADLGYDDPDVGAECQHIKHVETQLPYATLVAVVCAVGYLISGFTRTPWISIVVGIALLIAAVTVLSGRKAE